MENGDTPAAAGTATAMSLHEGQAKLASLLGNPRQAGTAAGEGQRKDPPDPEPARVDEPADDIRPESGAPSDDDAPAPAGASEEPRVRLPDGSEATLAEVEEWRKGHLRQSDYTRKTTTLAEERRALEAEKSSIASRAKFFDDRIGMAIAVAEAHLPKAPDPALLTTDPIGYFQQKEVFEARRAQLQQLFQAKQEHDARVVAEQRQAFETYAAREKDALVAAIPEFRDKAKVQAFLGEVIEALPHYGFGKEDLATVHDHRLIRLIRDAVAWRKVQGAKPQALDKARTLPPVQEPGRRASPDELAARNRSDDLARLKKTGRMADATALLARRLKAANR